MKVVMLGADRSVKGGVSAVVNNLYEAGLDQRIDLTYIGTMVDGSTAAKLLKGVQALLQFVTVLPKADIVHLNMAADASCYRKLIFMQIALWFHKKVVIHEHGGDFQGFYYKRCSAKQKNVKPCGFVFGADGCLERFFRRHGGSGQNPCPAECGSGSENAENRL